MPGILLVEQNARMALMAAHRGYVLQTGHVVEGTATDSGSLISWCKCLFR